MTQYSYAQLEQLWINAGGPKALAPTMAAIAEAESGGNSNAYNASGATGLWQILGAVYPKDQASLRNPTVNAHEAVAKYKTQGLGAWVTYTSGAYKGFLNGKTTPDPNVPDATLTSSNQADCLWFITYPGGQAGGFIGAGIGDLLNPGKIEVPTGSGTCLFSKGEARALLGGLMMVGGGIIGAVGLAVLVASGLGGTKAGQAVTSVIPEAAVLKAASTVGRARKAVPAAKPPGPRSPAQGRHARTGANAPAQGRHAAPES